MGNNKKIGFLFFSKRGGEFKGNLSLALNSFKQKVIFP